MAVLGPISHACLIDALLPHFLLSMLFKMMLQRISWHMLLFVQVQIFLYRCPDVELLVSRENVFNDQFWKQTCLFP